jgi:hypothetical protein
MKSIGNLELGQWRKLFIFKLYSTMPSLDVLEPWKYSFHILFVGINLVIGKELED